MTNTKIFARWLAGSAAPHQALVYQMSYASKKDVAMILPLPVMAGGGEDAVEFLNLEKEPDLFVKLEKLFPESTSGKISVGYAAVEPTSPYLAVKKVGSFEASFVPTQADFARVDPRYRLNPKVWKKLPQYRDWGFAVFRLRKEANTVHPMALSFPSARPGNGLFFPTVHIHDGKVHPVEEFAHVLYCQIPQGTKPPPSWEESEKIPSSLGQLADSGLLHSSRHVYRQHLYGELPNTDTYA